MCCSYKLCYENNIKNNILAVVLKTVEITKQIQNNTCTIKGINFICNFTRIAILEFMWDIKILISFKLRKVYEKDPKNVCLILTSSEKRE